MKFRKHCVQVHWSALIIISCKCKMSDQNIKLRMEMGNVPKRQQPDHRKKQQHIYFATCETICTFSIYLIKLDASIYQTKTVCVLWIYECKWDSQWDWKYMQNICKVYAKYMQSTCKVYAKYMQRGRGYKKVWISRVIIKTIYTGEFRGNIFKHAILIEIITIVSGIVLIWYKHLWMKAKGCTMYCRAYWPPNLPLVDRCT